MKYTVSIIDTEEKFRQKFRSAPHWQISIPQNNAEKSSGDKMRGIKPKRKRNDGT
jgi:hypothetical protein